MARAATASDLTWRWSSDSTAIRSRVLIQTAAWGTVHRRACSASVIGGFVLRSVEGGQSGSLVRIRAFDGKTWLRVARVARRRDTHIGLRWQVNRNVHEMP